MSSTGAESPMHIGRVHHGHGTTLAFKRLLSNSSDTANHIRELAVNITKEDLREIGHAETFEKMMQLQALTVISSRHSQLLFFNETKQFSWDDNPIRQGLLHLLHLPTLVSLHLQSIEHFIVSDLVPCTNLKHIYLSELSIARTSPSARITVFPIQPRSLFCGTRSAPIFLEMCAMQCGDGSPFFDLSRVTDVTFEVVKPQDLKYLRRILSHCKSLVSLKAINYNNLATPPDFKTSTIFLNIFSTTTAESIQTLKRIDMIISFSDSYSTLRDKGDPFRGFVDALENIEKIEDITIEVVIEVGSTYGLLAKWARLDQVLTRPGWSTLRKVSLTIKTHRYAWDPSNHVAQTIEAFPKTHFSGLSSHNFVVFDFRHVSRTK
ncbi:hypothetical protein BDN70DRAFT_934537 [Pholiota conissans]|uniref:Uncharacterized protein n=1 Tax=Pholiota conissans TaxID=109636 RepID=A0A9P5YX47_9AGAR|nr:hypothetical protein BDN70DRAFT_934537 [Pholiota conissans]